MTFVPPGEPIDATLWKPNAALCEMALRRCSWVNCDKINNIEDVEEWLRTIIIGAYYQGLADGVKHMARKLKDGKHA